MSHAGDIATFVATRGITRVTHFTNSRNFPGILQTGEILPTATLIERGISHNITDPERYDGLLSHVCCNVEYPNAYYFSKAARRPNHTNFSDWMLLLIDPSILTAPGVLFAPANAAKLSGTTLADGVTGLSNQYAQSVNGYARQPKHLLACPTDVQAEVLVPNGIPLSLVRAIVVPSAAAVTREFSRLAVLGHDPYVFDWFQSESMFQGPKVRNAVHGLVPLDLQGPFQPEDEVPE
ncbi:DarT ssDNA thymidine ADP-ribosyltransferase family protein [Microbacterium sp. As-52]|uniref:DarT ssDNA thymidine ADP-ribosyltransferase family protein n=1 Tax=Microbacterium sp. As-52 TaxID=3390503 RepID=UPI003CEF1F70